MLYDRTANLLGAVAQLVTDQQLEAIESVSGLSPSSASALVTVGHAPGESIDFLRRTINRSHSATVRLVNGLIEEGYLVRGECDDARAVTLTLTAKGKSIAEKILTKRSEILEAFLNYLTKKEKRQIDSLLAKLLSFSVLDEQHAYQICRLCNESECDVCPIEESLEQHNSA